MKRVLITGASGFIGSHCISPLLDLGYEVHAVSQKTKCDEIAGVQYHNANLLDDSELTMLFDKVKPGYLLHTAWIVEPGEALTSDKNSLWVEKTLAMVRHFKRNGGRRMVATGTCYEYDVNYGTCSEDSTPLAPVTYYGISKNALRSILQIDAEKSGYSFAWARLFYLYGPRENPKRLVPSVITSLLGSGTANCSHGMQLRDYIYVQDAADGLVTLLDSDLSGAYNISAGKAVTLQDIVRNIAGQLQGEDRVNFGAQAARSEEVPLIVGDNEKFKSKTGWTPKTDLDSGVSQTIDWWRNRIKSKKA